MIPSFLSFRRRGIAITAHNATTSPRRSARWLGLLGLASLAMSLNGCVSYTTYPVEPGHAALKGPNALGVQEVMIAGLRWVLERYPADGKPDRLRDPSSPLPATPFTINLPVGLSEESVRLVIKALEPGAQPLIAGNENLPIYHVKYIRIRGDEADMHIFRPVFSLGPMPSGDRLYQEMRLRLRGGLNRWHVEYGLNWTPGSGIPPELNFIARPRDPGEYIEGRPVRRPAPEPEPLQDPVVEPSTADDSQPQGAAGVLDGYMPIYAMPADDKPSPEEGSELVKEFLENPNLGGTPTKPR